MKTNIILVVIIIILSVLIAITLIDKENDKIRFYDCEVVNVRDGIVTCLDYTGDIWEFYGTGFKVDDYARLTVQNKRVIYAKLVWSKES